MDQDAPNQDPIVPGQQEQAETAGSVTPAPQAPQDLQAVPKGVQERIDELTRNWRETQRELSRKDELIMQLVAERSQVPHAPAPTPEDPFKHFAEEDRPKLQHAFEAVLNPLRSQLEQANRQLRAMTMSQQVAQVAPTAPPEVQQRAAQLIQAWQQKGLDGWKLEDAVTFATGELLREGKLAPQAPAPPQPPRAANGQYMTSAQNLPSNSPSPTPAPPPKGLPANLESLPLEKQIEIMEKLYGNMPL